MASKQKIKKEILNEIELSVDFNSGYYDDEIDFIIEEAFETYPELREHEREEIIDEVTEELFGKEDDFNEEDLIDYDTFEDNELEEFIQRNKTYNYTNEDEEF
jgi:hypothetical protein